MSIPSHFNDAIALVDPALSLSFTVSGGYAPLEWSYSGLEVTGGSDNACMMGAAALLDAMGFRFYAPQPAFWKLPETVRTDLARSRTVNWIPSAATFLVYGHSWAGTKAASRAFLNDSYARWQALVGLVPQSYPAGHRWNNVIVNSPEFFSANPDLLRLTSGGAQTFDLAGIRATEGWGLLAEYCAAFLLDAGLNEFNRTHFDPVDGDDNPSDLVYPFCSEVAARMRAGTGAVGGLPAQAGVPDAAIGVYAYAGHRLPPSAPYPGVYTQVALAFNSTGLSYQDLVDGHGALADAIGIREYLDTQVWSGGRPMANARNKAGYLDRYDDYQASGAVEVNSEFTANWLVNMVLARAHVLKFRTGRESFVAIAQELVEDIFSGDPAVLDLYRYWTQPSSKYNKYSLRQSFVMTDRMADGWYKTYFKQLLTIYYQYHRTENYASYGIVRAPSNPGADTFAAEISKLLSWVTAMRDDDVIHSYALIRQEANSALDDYPSLKFNASPEPAWFASPAKPTESDWNAAYAAILAETARDDVLDDPELVLYTVTPVTTGRNLTPASMYRSNAGGASYLVVGPCSLTVNDLTSGDSSTTKYPAGLFTMYVDGNHSVSWARGKVFMDTFPSVRKDLDAQGRNHWLYVQASAAGHVNLAPIARWSFFDEEPARKDWTPTMAFPSLGPGQVCVDNTNTIGDMANMNVNRYLSPDPRVALVPRALARREGRGSIVRIIPEPD